MPMWWSLNWYNISMNIEKDKMLKITVAVDNEPAGGMFVTTETYQQFSKLIDSIVSGKSISVVKTEIYKPIYKVGSVLDENFVGNEEDIIGSNPSTELEVFMLVCDNEVVYLDNLRYDYFEGLIAAYQSNPTFTIEQVPHGQFR